MASGKKDTQSGQSLRLPARQIVQLRPPRPGELIAESGTLWVTGDRPGDHLLKAGARLPFVAGETLVAQALGGAACARLAFAGQ